MHRLLLLLRDRRPICAARRPRPDRQLRLIRSAPLHHRTIRLDSMRFLDRSEWLRAIRRRPRLRLNLLQRRPRVLRRHHQPRPQFRKIFSRRNRPLQRQERKRPLFQNRQLRQRLPKRLLFRSLQHLRRKRLSFRSPRLPRPARPVCLALGLPCPMSQSALHRWVAFRDLRQRRRNRQCGRSASRTHCSFRSPL